MATPVHLVAGFLGAGKTTALVRELALRKDQERCAVVVNDFGDAQIDASLLDGGVGVTNIPGGCMCCTAPEGLAPAIAAILEELRPDRIFIEPSGLARPRDLIDMLGRGGLRDRIELMPTIVLVDPGRVGDEPALVKEQLEAADFVVLSRVDLATPTAVAEARTRVEAGWPPPMAVLEMRAGELPRDVFSWPEGQGPRARGLVFVPDRPSTDGYAARSWVFPPAVVFSWDALKTLIVRARAERFKGVFHTDLGWYRVEVAGGRFHPSFAAWRRDSRCDLIVPVGGDLEGFDAALRAAILPESSAPYEGEPTVEVVEASGLVFPLTRGALRALPGQVPDVGALVPGRAGAGVRLAEVLRLGGAGSHYVLVANDGMTTEPAALADVGEAVLVHSLGGEPLTAAQGGPFRLYAPSASNCANVKGVAKVRVLAT